MTVLEHCRIQLQATLTELGWVIQALSVISTPGYCTEVMPHEKQVSRINLNGLS